MVALLHKSREDSSCESRVVAVVHEQQTDPAELQDQELAGLQCGAEEARFSHDLV